MSEPETLLAACVQRLAGHRGATDLPEASTSRVMGGMSVVVTAGPTREAIDPVRYISNHSSGKQGYAIARAAAEAGAAVTLITGPVDLAPPPGVTVMPVVSAQEMHDASLAAAKGSSLFIAVAAVADYRPAAAADRKLKKDQQAGGLALDLVENPDIVAAVAALPNPPVVVGFAAETHDALANARAKLVRKGLDAIVVNDVSRSDIGFGAEHNAVTLIWADGELLLPKQDKLALARTLLDQLTELFVRQLAHTNPENVAN